MFTNPKVLNVEFLKNKPLEKKINIFKKKIEEINPNIDYMSLFEKYVKGSTKFYFDEKTKNVIGFYNKELDKVIITKEYNDHLKNLEDNTDDVINENITTDDILDKISKNGIDSLTDLERKKLNNSKL